MGEENPLHHSFEIVDAQDGLRGDRDARTLRCNRLVAVLPRTDASVGHLIMPDLYCSIAVIFRNLQLRGES